MLCQAINTDHLRKKKNVDAEDQDGEESDSGDEEEAEEQPDRGKTGGWAGGEPAAVKKEQKQVPPHPVPQNTVRVPRPCLLTVVW